MKTQPENTIFTPRFFDAMVHSSGEENNWMEGGDLISFPNQNQESSKTGQNKVAEVVDFFSGEVNGGEFMNLAGIEEVSPEGIEVVE